MAFNETAIAKTPEAHTALVQELSGSPYMTIEILNVYLTEVSHIYTWSMGGFQIDMWIPTQTVKEWRYRVAKWMQRLENVRVWYGSTKSIHFICVPLDVPRRFPSESHQCLGKAHVNGGYTYVNGNEVYLFRKEELSKVLLHEYLHQVQGHKDAEWYAHPEQLERIRTCAEIPQGIDIRPNEAVVECWALWHHTRCLSEETGIPFKTLWAAEVSFAYSQACRVWAHQGLCVPRWNEGTHTFSYYILKAFLVWAWDKKNVWQLKYNVKAFVDWVQLHWPTWQTRLESVGQQRTKGVSARMTLLGDW